MSWKKLGGGEVKWEDEKALLGEEFQGKVFVNFTFPHFHIILLHFSTYSWVWFY